jgi:hypothetical protein
MKTLKEKIEVMQAALDGKELELQRQRNVEWTKIDKCAIDGLYWNWEDFDYRIAPPKKQRFITVGELPAIFFLVHPNNPKDYYLVTGFLSGDFKSNCSHCARPPEGWHNLGWQYALRPQGTPQSFLLF